MEGEESPGPARRRPSLTASASQRRPSNAAAAAEGSNDVDLFVDLLDAAVEGNLGRVQSLLKVLDVGTASRLDFRRNQPTFGESPLHRAGTVEVAKALVNHGVLVDLQGAVGQTPLHTLVSAPAVVTYLLKRGARVDAQTVDHSTPLHWAVVQDCAETVQILLRAGAQIDHQNDSGNAALHMVCSLDVARLLVSSGARLDLVNLEGQIPLEAAASKPEDDVHLQVASYLLDVSHSASLRASSSFNIFRPEFDGLDPQLQHGDSLDENGPAAPPAQDELAVPIASSTLKQHQLERQRQERQMEDPAGTTAAGSPGNFGPGTEMLPPILERQDTQDRVRSALKKVDARERWRLVRQHVLKGELRGTSSTLGAGGGLGALARTAKRLRFASDVASHVRSSSMASSWSDDGVPSLVQARTDEFYFRFFEVMVRDRPKLALRMLDRQRTFLYARGNDKIYSYDTLLTGGPVTSNEILDKMVQDERHELISHEVVQWVFNIRWVLFTREALLFEFAMHCIFVASFLVTTLYGEENLWVCFSQARAFFQHGPGAHRAEHLGQAALEVLLFLLNMRYLLRFVIELNIRRGRGANVYSNPFTDALPHACVFTEQVLRFVVATRVDTVEINDVSNIVSGVGAVLLWIRLLSFAEGFEVIGVTMCTIRRMLADIIIYLIVLLVFVTGFSHGLTLLFRGSGSPIYGTMYNSWITLYFFVFNLDVGALDDEPQVFRRYSGYAFIGIYMVVVALVILNLIIAIMTNTFDEIQHNAKEQWLLQRARIILTYDLREKSINKLWRTLCLPRRMRCLEDEDFGDDYLPELPRKNIVVEKGTGQVELQVPAEWLHAVNLIRRRSPTYNALRYRLFRRWKKLRRSPSFLWPELSQTRAFFDAVEADEQRIAQQAISNETLHRNSVSSSPDDDDDEYDDDQGEDSQEEGDSEAYSARQRGDGSKVPLLKGQPSQRLWGTFDDGKTKQLRPKSTSSSTASSYASARESAAARSEATNMKRYSSTENAALRTGVEEELLRIGSFHRNSKRLAADRVIQSTVQLQRAAPLSPLAASDLASVSSHQDMHEDQAGMLGRPGSPRSAGAEAGGDGISGPMDAGSVTGSALYSSSAAAMAAVAATTTSGPTRRRAKSFKRHTSTYEGQVQQEVEEMHDVMALHGAVPSHASAMEDTMNLRNEAAIEHLTGLVVRLSEQVSALEDKISAAASLPQAPETLFKSGEMSLQRAREHASLVGAGAARESGGGKAQTTSSQASQSTRGQRE